MTKLSIALFAVILTGCATGDEYRQYTEAQKAVSNARAMAEAARYQALTEIAKTGDSTAKTAAVMSLSTPATIQTVVAPERKWYQFK